MSAPALAGDREAADRLFEEALTLSDAGNWEAACPKFSESYTADPSVGALLNMGTCSERKGDLLLAKQQYAEAATRNQSTEDPLRREAVTQQLATAVAALELRIPRIVVAAQPGTRVLVDGVPAAADAQGTAVAIGKHVVRVEADGFVSQEKAVDVVEKQRLRLEITLVPVPRPVERPKAPAPPPRAPSGMLVPGIVLGAVGLAAAGAGGGLLGVASSKASQIAELCGDDPEPPACFGSEAAAAEATELSESGRPMEIAGGVLVGVGGASLLTGVILLAVSGTRGPETEGVAVTPLVGPETFGFGLSARF